MQWSSLKLPNFRYHLDVVIPTPNFGCCIRDYCWRERGNVSKASCNTSWVSLLEMGQDFPSPLQIIFGIFVELSWIFLDLLRPCCHSTLRFLFAWQRARKFSNCDETKMQSLLRPIRVQSLQVLEGYCVHPDSVDQCEHGMEMTGDCPDFCTHALPTSFNLNKFP